jgi:guanylate kinase
MAALVNARIKRRGLMLVLSSPSGAGKSTIARNLLEADKALTLSVSATTRPRRGSEIHGTHYLFVSRRDFEIMRDSEELLEWAEVHGNFYGTPRAPAEMAMSEGRDMLFDIDWQGAVQMRQKVPADIVSIFILPPSMTELRARLLRRAEDQEKVIEQRLRNAREELEHWGEYDYVVINHDLQQAFHEVQSIVTAERLRRDRRPGLFDFVSGLLDEKV